MKHRPRAPTTNQLRRRREVTVRAQRRTRRLETLQETAADEGRAVQARPCSVAACAAHYAALAERSSIETVRSMVKANTGQIRPLYS